MKRMLKVLKPSYNALRQEFGITYASEKALARAKKFKWAKLCTSSYRLFVRNSPNETWVPLLGDHGSGLAPTPAAPNATALAARAMRSPSNSLLRG